MANALKTLFSDIAVAIRNKTGKTDEMKPADFPSAIDGIVVGSGSGGGSLPTGAYWETLDILFKNNYTQQWFEFNGNLYALIGTVAGSGGLGGIYQYSNGSWTQIGSSFSNVNAGASSSKLQEYNGKLHLFPSETTKHIVFDGTNITVMNELPNRVYLRPSFVQDGLLKFYSYYDGSIYVWDESSDTWTKESTVGKKYDYYDFFNVNGAVYAYLLKKIYTYNNGVLTQVGTITDSIFGVTVFENKIFYTSSQSGNSSHKIWCYDPTNNTERRVGTVPHWNGYSTLFVYNGKLCVLNSGIANSYFAASALHEVDGSGSAGGSGDGSVEGIHTVTFMSEDGQTELFKRPVADGDNCADPVARGLMDAPTKESTAQYDYTHAGWSATPGGSADSSVLNAVKADKTVYAAFTASTRYYTIRFFDGDTLLHTVLSEYGSTPAYTPTETPEESAFGGWSPELTPVTGDASYYVIWTNATPFLERQTLAFEQYSSTKYKPYLAKAEVTVPSNFAVGDEFVVEWDGIEYNCKCKYSEIKYTLSFGGTTSNLESSRNTLGNTGIISTLTKWNGYGISSVTPAATSEPFYMYTPSDGVLVIETQDTSATHTVRIKKQ